jgi:peptidoglycan/LPS O-acetylase OafA/YrhL
MTSGATTVSDERAAARGLVDTEVGNPRAEARSPIAHLGAVDWLRLIAILGVAYYHAFNNWYPDSIVAPYLFAGLHALTAASVYFAATSRSGTSDRDIVVKRFHRLIVPWLAWGALFTVMAIRSGKFRWSMLWVGGSTHLWFLPFIFVVGCAIAMARRRGLIVRSPKQAIFWTFLAIAATVIEPHLGPLVTTVEPVWQIVNATPSVLMGLAIFALPVNATRSIAIKQLLLFAIAGILARVFQPDVTLAWAAAAACGSVLFGIARLLPVHATPASSFVARTSFGVYLLHLVALTIVIRVLAKLVHAPLNESGAVASDALGLIIAAQVVAAVVASLVAVAVLEKTPLRRFIA